MEPINKILSKDVLERNKGQINGLPKNPRFIVDERFKALRKSIADAPEMLKLRPLIVVEHRNKYVIIGGNMRFKAACSLSIKEFPCVILPASTSVEKLREYTIKDNISFGQNDWDVIKFEWNANELTDWGELLDYAPPSEIVDDIAKQWRETNKDDREANQVAKRLAWGTSENFKEATCDLKVSQFLTYVGGYYYLTSFRKSEEGVPLTQIKCPANVELFSDQAMDIIRGTLLSGKIQDWGIICPPPRRHVGEFNFARAVTSTIAKKLGINDYSKAIKNYNRDRLNPVFELLEPIPTSNVILYDDIITTMNTMQACRNLLRGKNVFAVAGIRNR